MLAPDFCPIGSRPCAVPVVPDGWCPFTIRGTAFNGDFATKLREAVFLRVVRAV